MEGEKMRVETTMKTPSIESVEKLKRKLHEKDEKMKELKQETRSFIDELDSAYKELRKTQEELIVKEKLNVVGGLATGIAHEIRSSLNVIGMSVQHLHNKFNPGDERREFTEAVLDKVEKLNRVASDLVQFARPHEPNFQKSDVHEILDRVLNLVKFKCVVQKVKIKKNYESYLPQIMVDKELIETVFLNLLDNALWSMPKGGDLTISTSNSNKRNSVEVKMSDSGVGISPSDRQHIFDPFFTRKESGSGLGLSIVHRIIEEHTGYITVESELKKGTTFLIKLPVSPKK
jgi:signal transduction histidine kinase